MSKKEDQSPADRVSESVPAYGKRKRFRGTKVVVSIEERKKMPAPFPSEPDFVAELLAEAERREKARAK